MSSGIRLMSYRVAPTAIALAVAGLFVSTVDADDSAEFFAAL